MNVNRDLVVMDVDGVVLDFYKGAARVLEEMLGRPMVKVDPRPATKYRYGLTDEEYQRMRVVMRTHEHGWGNLPTLPGAVEGIHRLIKSGKTVAFLSSCGQSLFDLRRENLDRLGLSHCALMCVEDADKNAKGVVLEKIRPGVFMDDHMKMLAQATCVPERVWIDHGCSLETNSEGVPFIDLHPVQRVASVDEWVSGLFSRSHPDYSSYRSADISRRKMAY